MQAALYFCLKSSNLTLRCIEHSLHLTTKHFVKSITPLPCDTCDTSGGDCASDDNCNKDDEDIDSSDLLRKVIAFMKQVSSITILTYFPYSCSCFRFINLHRQDLSSMQLALKLGCPHLSSYCGSALVGGHSLTSWSISFFSKQCMILQLSQLCCPVNS